MGARTGPSQALNFDSWIVQVPTVPDYWTFVALPRAALPLHREAEISESSATSQGSGLIFFPLQLSVSRLSCLLHSNHRHTSTTSTCGSME